MLICKLNALGRRVDSVHAFKTESAETFTQDAGSTANIKCMNLCKCLVVSLARLLNLIEKVLANKIDSQAVKFV